MPKEEYTRTCLNCETLFTTNNITKKFCCYNCGTAFRSREAFKKLSYEERRAIYHQRSQNLSLQKKKKYEALKQHHPCLKCGIDISQLHFRTKYCDTCFGNLKREKQREYRQRHKENL
jgi:predicted RNA-binding Zn-ribbon protein involved in translation (DUF1610 family)